METELLAGGGVAGGIGLFIAVRLLQILKGFVNRLLTIVENHLQHSTASQVQLAEAIRELTRLIRRKIREPGGVFGSEHADE